MPRPRWYDLPLVWWLVHAGELVVITFVLRLAGFHDETASWPIAARIAATVGVFVLVGSANLAALRHLRRKDEARSANEAP